MIIEAKPLHKKKKRLKKLSTKTVSNVKYRDNVDRALFMTSTSSYCLVLQYNFKIKISNLLL